MLGLGQNQVLILLSSHQQRDTQCWPFRQKPANRLESHPKHLWGVTESSFCRQKRDITVPLALTSNDHTI